MPGTRDTLVNRTKTYAHVVLTFQVWQVLTGRGDGHKQETAQIVNCISLYDMDIAARERSVCEVWHPAWHRWAAHKGRRQLLHRPLHRHTHCAIFADITAPCKHPQMPAFDRNSSP